MDDLEDWGLEDAKDWDYWLKEVDEGTRSNLYAEADAYIIDDVENDTSSPETSNAATEIQPQRDTRLASGSSTVATEIQPQEDTHLASGSSNVATEIQTQEGTHLASGSSNVATEIQSQGDTHLASESSNVATKNQSQGGTSLASRGPRSSSAAAKRRQALNDTQLAELMVKLDIPIQWLIPILEPKIGKEKADQARIICDRLSVTNLVYDKRARVFRETHFTSAIFSEDGDQYSSRYEYAYEFPGCRHDKEGHNRVQEIMWYNSQFASYFTQKQDVNSARKSEKQMSVSAEPQCVENEETNKTCSSDSSYPDLEELRRKHINLSHVNWHEIEYDDTSAPDTHLGIIGVPIKVLIPIIEPQIGKEKADQALMVWNKVQNKEISIKEAVSMVRDFLDFNMLKMAALFYSRLQATVSVSEKQGQKSVEKRRRSRAVQPQIHDETGPSHIDTCKKCQDRRHPVSPTKTISQSDKSESTEKHPLSPEETPEETSPPPSSPLKKQKESGGDGEED